jgi:hypothetical protein
MRQPKIRWIALIAALVVAPWLVAAAGSGKKTHLGVAPGQVVSVRTYQLLNDNQTGPFYPDRQGIVPFSVPEGFSFVVTDIFVHVASVPYSAANEHWVQVYFVENATRSIDFRFEGDETRHYAIAGAYVIPGGAMPLGRNVDYSDTPAEIQLLGYFVKAPGLAPGALPFPPPAP